MSAIIIKSAGLLTTVQDCGRYGYQRFGMSVAGAMDVFSLQLANILVGNRYNDACFETTLIGPEIEFTSTRGADMSPCINGKAISLYKTIEVRPGDQLSFEALRSGCRSYIAFAGGIQVPKVMGSSSTYLRAKVGGFEGRPVKVGDVLNLGPIPAKIQIKEIKKALIPNYNLTQTIRIIPGPEVNHFGIDGITNFLTSEFAVTDQSDRMGFRLSGPKIEHQTERADIISAGISFGTIQVPGNGQPIILMADRQTTGGYSRIANVISVDFTLLAQLKPGDIINFSEVKLDIAQKLYIARQKEIDGLI
jgi:antagonist of KipI